MATAWDKLEQLLTCAICLDRFRNPKMLPCQHSFCQEPCMEGLQDYARRQIKCPECRAEHRIPFQGIQSYPTNVTLQRFLELHQSITGEEPEPVPSMMERCGVCSEKSTVTRCNHCDKKVCPECKEAHIDILKREISRICHQVRRALNRLQDALSQTERSMERLNVNSVHIRDEIEEIVRRFVRDLKAQEDKMLKDLETYSQVESKNLTKLKEDLAIEYDFLKDNCDLVEKNIIDPEKTWNDVELCEVKFIFVKTLDFLRNFDADAADYTRGMKFLPSSELDSLRRNLVNFGELKLLTLEESNANVHASSPGLMSTTGIGSSSLSVPQQSMLMRSQSDHRLATQFARRDSRMADLTQSRLNTPGYSDSEKDPRDPNRATSPSGYSSRTRRDDGSRLGSRYGDDSRDPTSRRFLRDSSDTYRPGGYSRTDEDSFSSGPQFKSRFMRERGSELGFDDFDYDPSTYMPRSVRFEEPSSTTTTAAASAPLVKVFDTPEAPRGCLSGIVKISDTAHYMERSHENEVRAKVEKEKKEEESRNLPPPSSVSSYQPPSRPRPPSRQVSEDEIEKQKKMNQAASTASSVTTNRTNNSSALGNNNLTTTTTNSLSSNLTPSNIGLTSTPNSLDNYGSSLTSSTTVPSSDTIRPVARRIGSLRDDDDISTGRSYRDNNISSTTTTTPSSRRGVGSNEITPSSLVDDNDDDIDGSNLSRVGRRRRGSLSGEDSKDSLTSRSSQSTQASSATTASSSPSTTGTSRPVRAPLAKNLPIAEEEEDRDRDITRRRGPKSSSSLVNNNPVSSLGSSTFGKQTYNRNRSETRNADDEYASRGASVSIGRNDNGNDNQVEDEEEEEEEEDEEEEEEEEIEEDEEEEEEEDEDNEEPEEEEAVEEEEEEEEEDEDEDDNEEEEEEEDDNNDADSGTCDAESTRKNYPTYSQRMGGPFVSYTPQTPRHRSSTSNTTTPSPLSPTISTHLNKNTTGAYQSSPRKPSTTIPPSSSSSPSSTLPGSLHTNHQHPTSHSTDQTDKGRENGLPCSVADLLNRSAQVRRDSIELRHRFFEIDKPNTLPSQLSSDHRSLSGSISTHRGSPRWPQGSSTEKSSSTIRKLPLSKGLGSSLDSTKSSSASSSTRPSKASFHARSLPEDRLDRTVSPRNLKRHDKHSDHSRSRKNPSSSSPSYTLPSSSNDQHEPLRFHNTNDNSTRSVYSSARPLTNESASGFDNRTTTPSTIKTSNPSLLTLDRSNYHSTAYHSNPATERHITSALTSNPTSSAVHASTSAASNALSALNYNDLSNSRLSRSKSSHLLGVYSSGHDGSDDDDETVTPTVPTYRSRYAEANYGKEGRYQYRTRAQPKEREKSPALEDNSGSRDNNSTGANAWSQYLRNKYGSSRNSSASSTGSASRGTAGGKAGLSKSKSSHAVYSRNLSDSSDDEGAPTSTLGPKVLSRKGSLDASDTIPGGIGTSGASGAGESGRRPSYGYNLPRSTYLQKRRMMFKIGTRGTEPGCFTWPRGIACGPDNSIVVADSSNHRVQVFDSTGRFLHEFGSYGSAEGEFDCLAGVAVNRIGQYIVSDRYNHRVQIFDPSGRFLRSFGCEGRVDGRFSYPWGITTDSLGFIYVCDKENHRVQVFQSDGTFVGKFGAIGNRPGLLEHPHYIAVSNTNRVIVSDSNNHRIQIFDVNGRSLSTFGCEGTDEGQFKFPRGIAVDDQGYIIVGDSGNNRIQIFNPDGTFLKAFGSWGSSEGEFKGLEGVAVSTTGNILVCDRENHRIQVF